MATAHHKALPIIVVNSSAQKYIFLSAENDGYSKTYKLEQGIDVEIPMSDFLEMEGVIRQYESENKLIVRRRPTCRRIIR